jgi:hypothetical protein
VEATATFKSRAVRSLVELHERELRRFLETWKEFVASGAPLPDGKGDPAYESPELLGGHVLGAARGYLTWICEQVGRPAADVDASTDRAALARRADAFAEHVLDAWRRHLAALEDAELTPAVYTSRWGEPFLIEQMLEHAVVHPMRHRFQLEEILAKRA